MDKPLTESPIEADMLGALVNAAGNGAILRNATHVSMLERCRKDPAITVIAPQVRVDHYRADFIVGRGTLLIAVECDGAAFHTDQAKDDERDLYFQKKRIEVMRFSGKQIYRDMFRCADRVMARLTNRQEDQGSRQIGDALIGVFKAYERSAGEW